MTDFPRQVYLLNPGEFSPETIAVAFAKTSRSPESFIDIARELSDEKSAEFNEKWVVGYGHSSVAEHAVLHIAIENVSRLAVEAIESSRLASFTEKSTRYQKWSPEAYFTPQEIVDAGLEQDYRNGCRRLFEAYEHSLPLCREVIAASCGRTPGESDAAYERRLKSVYVDSSRFLLPAASLANVGMTINARTLEHLISKMLSHPLAEVRRIGEEMKAVAVAEIPTLVKYAGHNPYLQEAQSLALPAAPPDLHAERDFCRLVDHTADGETRFLAACLYRYGSADYAACQHRVQRMSPAEQEALLQSALGRMGRFDYPLREAEYITYTFDTIMDQGAYYEVKRHRMMTQSPQELVCSLGFATPRLFRQAGFEAEYRAVMEETRTVWQGLQTKAPAAAAYVVPNGFYRRVLLSMNLREAFHFTQLRSAPGAHYSVRLLAQRMAEQIRQVHPLLGAYLRPNPQETWQSVLHENFID